MVTGYGVLSALFLREQTGQGPSVDSAMLDSVLALSEWLVTVSSFTGESPKRGQLTGIAPRGAFAWREGCLSPNVPNDIWRGGFAWRRSAKQ